MQHRRAALMSGIPSLSRLFSAPAGRGHAQAGARRWRQWFSLSCLLTAILCCHGRADVTADFSELSLGTNQYWNGSDGSGGFSSRGIRFGNQFTSGGGFTSWAGFSYSRVDDSATPDYGNQYAVISGSGVGGTGTYAVVYDDAPWSESDIVTLPVPCAVKGFFVNNTTYAALAMRDGTAFSRKFGGPGGTDPDWFMLTITAQDEEGGVVGSTNVYLADYRFADSAQDTILTNWTWVSLTSLGSNVKTLHFALSSSDSGAYGMNNPAYFAMDNLTTLESYAPAAGQPGSTAVYMITNALIDWATGWTNYEVGANCDLTWQTPNLATGVAVGSSYDIVCLGEGGRITMTFGTPIHDGPGSDFAVFENGVSDTFLEMAFVEVSSDGTNFTRFFNRSITTNPVPAFGSVKPEDVTGLGGKYRQGYGEPFDLGALRSSPGLDVNNIRFVRLLDVSGNGSCTDSVGHVIYDPYLATGSAGFDLDAIGVLSNAFQEVFVEAIRSVASRQGPSNGIFRVTRKTWDADAPLDVAIVLVGTASNGADYAWVTNAVHIPAGFLTQDVSIVPILDASAEGDRSVILQVASNAAYQVEQRGARARVTLEDIPRVSVAASASVAGEAGDATGAVVIARNAVRSGYPLDIRMVLGGSATASDYRGLTNLVTLPADVLSTTLVVQAVNDSVIEGDETVVVSLLPDAAYRSGAVTQAAIVLCDPPIDAWRLTAASPHFGDLPFASGDYWNGSDGSGGFTIEGVHFKNAFTNDGVYTSWAGFSYSRVNDSTTTGYGNQYAVISGSGVGNTGGVYVVAYDDGPWAESDIITLPSPARVLGFYINNTTYAALSMRDGDGFSRKFCAASNDWFKVTVSGRDGGGGTVGSSDFYLADFRFADTNENYIVTNWTWVSLTNFGSNVKSLHFALSSSDNSGGYMNTPAYFAMDGFQVDPASPAFSDAASWSGRGPANLMRYALGRAAAADDAPEFSPKSAAPFFEVTYRRRRNLPDVGIGVEACTTLTGGANWSTNGVVETEEGVDAGVATIRARIPGSNSNAVSFARLRAWRK